jgi:hypothetical protein
MTEAEGSATTAGGEFTAARPGPSASRASRQIWPGRGLEPPDVFGHLGDSTVSAWSVFLSGSNGSSEVMGVPRC